MDSALLPDMITEVLANDAPSPDILPHGKYFCTYCKSPARLRRGQVRIDHFAHDVHNEFCPRSAELSAGSWGFTDIDHFFTSKIPVTSTSINSIFLPFFRRIRNEAFKDPPIISTWAITHYFPYLYTKQHSRLLSFFDEIKRNKLFTDVSNIIELLRCSINIEFQLKQYNDIQDNALLINVYLRLLKIEENTPKHHRATDELHLFFSSVTKEVLNKVIGRLHYSDTSWHWIKNYLFNKKDLDIELYYRNFILNPSTSRKQYRCYIDTLTDYCTRSDTRDNLKTVIMKYPVPEDAEELFNSLLQTFSGDQEILLKIIKDAGERYFQKTKSFLMNIETSTCTKALSDKKKSNRISKRYQNRIKSILNNK